MIEYSGYRFAKMYTVLSYMQLNRIELNKIVETKSVKRFTQMCNQQTVGSVNLQSGLERN